MAVRAVYIPPFAKSAKDGAPELLWLVESVRVGYPADPHTLKVMYRSDGKVRRENTFVLSADGKTIKETDVTPAPSPSTMSVTFHKS